MHDAHEVSSGGSAIGIAALRLGILALPMATGDASVRHVRQRGLRQARPSAAMKVAEEYSSKFSSPSLASSSADAP